MMNQLTKTIFLFVACIFVFEISAQQSSIVLSDLHAGIGSESGVVNPTDKYLMAEMKVAGIEMMNGLDVFIHFNSSSTPVQRIHYTVVKIQNVYVLRDSEGKEMLIKNNKIQIISILNVNQNLIKNIEFTGNGNNGVSSNTLIKQF